MNDDQPGVHNELSGSAENALLARDIHGGVHNHIYGRRRAEPARMMPSVTPYFVNQLRVLGQADAAFDIHGLRTLVFCGLPGSGRKEAARQWGGRRCESFPDGQFHVDLSVGAEGREATALREFLIAAGLDPSEIPGNEEGRAACFRSWSTDKKVLVSVDNALTPRQVRMLSPGPGESVMLVTAAGRMPGLGERDSVEYIELTPLEDEAAVELLARLIRRERVDREPEAARALTAACEGLPIALCVVGALLAGRPNRKLARQVAELADERRRLMALSRYDDLSVTAVFNTAYERLSPATRGLYRVLGLHPGAGSVSAEVLEMVLGGEVDGLIDELVRAGLVRETEDERVVMHGMTRLHARGVAPGEDSEVVLDRMLGYYLRTTIAAGHAAMPGRIWLRRFAPDGFADGAPEEPMSWLEAERVNTRAVVDALADRGRWLDVCLMAVALWPLHEHGKYVEDQVSVNAAALAAADELARSDLASLAGQQQAFGWLHEGKPEAALAASERAVDAAAGQIELEASASEVAGLAALALGRRDSAAHWLRRSLELAEVIGDPRRSALIRLHLGKAVDPEQAHASLTAALDGFLELSPPEPVNVAKARLWLGRVATGLGWFAQAGDELNTALQLMRDHDRTYDRALCLEALGALANAQGDSRLASRRYQEALAVTEACGFRPDTDRIKAALASLDGGGVPAPADGG
ncbi:hypothetical protein EV193_11528 [Herbihabitans rhizosphaerae]|uniref:NB-ARC domain-containing protein n=1 Tax=Herbihabitans rhizosphaerae TaxID=1872711 RepID=A0A4Q7KCF7_9PSEU|nr:tetratricopeptide repeat protein [Herbihabitans rhizosphaerae]RZS31149.1 hypothetical protein EV193_11528 [Herbihabitans rhizosphaerae]